MRLLSAVTVGLAALLSTGPALADRSDAPLADRSDAPLADQSDVPADFVKEQESDSLVPYVGFNIGGGLSVPISDAGNRFDLGGAFQVGITYNVTPKLGVQAEYLYSGYDIKSSALNAAGVDGSHSMQYGNLNAVFQVMPSRPFGLYVLGGPGIYYRRVSITEFAGTTVVPYCDPWLYICYPTAVGVEQILGQRSKTDFGLNAGLGLSLRVFGGPVRIYLEGRYHYIFSSDIDTPAGPKKADGQYLPIILGIRL